MPDQTIYARITADDREAPLCDFCRAPHPIWLYPAGAFVIAMITPDSWHEQDFGDDGWASCETCASFVERGYKERLFKRMLGAVNTRGLAPDAVAVVEDANRQILDGFWSHRDGPRTRYRPAAPAPRPMPSTSTEHGG